MKEEFKYTTHRNNMKNHILASSEELIMERGIDEINLKLIAENCKITRATLYRYFSSKNEIVWDIYYKYAREMASMVVEELGGATSTFERIKTILTSIKRYFVSHENARNFYMKLNIRTLNSHDYSVIEGRSFSQGARPRDVLENICNSFNDGSVKEGLDPYITTVTMVYSYYLFVINVFTLKNVTKDKNRVDVDLMLDFQLNSCLDTIKR